MSGFIRIKGYPNSQVELKLPPVKKNGIIIYYEKRQDGRYNAKGYRYQANRDYQKFENPFLRACLQALDHLHATQAMHLDLEGNGQKTDILAKLIEGVREDGKHFTLKIFESEDERSKHHNNKMKFAYEYGIIVNKNGASQEEMDKTSETGIVTENLGINSPTSQLGHELIHAYHYNFDRGEYDKETRTWKPKVGLEGRKKDKSTFHRHDFEKKHYTNAEEKRATELGNQINSALGEDLRWDYRVVKACKMVNVISTTISNDEK